MHIDNADNEDTLDKVTRVEVSGHTNIVQRGEAQILEDRAD